MGLTATGAATALGHRRLLVLRSTAALDCRGLLVLWSTAALGCRGLLVPRSTAALDCRGLLVLRSAAAFGCRLLGRLWSGVALDRRLLIAMAPRALLPVRLTWLLSGASLRLMLLRLLLQLLHSPATLWLLLPSTLAGGRLRRLAARGTRWVVAKASLLAGRERLRRLHAIGRADHVLRLPYCHPRAHVSAAQILSTHFQRAGNFCCAREHDRSYLIVAQRPPADRGDDAWRNSRIDREACSAVADQQRCLQNPGTGGFDSKMDEARPWLCVARKWRGKRLLLRLHCNRHWERCDRSLAAI